MTTVAYSPALFHAEPGVVLDMNFSLRNQTHARTLVLAYDDELATQLAKTRRLFYLASPAPLGNQQSLKALNHFITHRYTLSGLAVSSTSSA
jgi:hypothetical protein